jgi:hypothetical protein
MAELKTKATDASVDEFIASLSDEQTRNDCRTLIRLMTRVTRSRPKMWGPSIVGFGKYHYVYDSGREGDWFLTGFSPRKQNLTVYIMGGMKQFKKNMTRLGKFKSSNGGCLYFKTLDDIDTRVLESIVRISVQTLKKTSR